MMKHLKRKSRMDDTAKLQLAAVESELDDLIEVIKAHVSFDWCSYDEF